MDKKVVQSLELLFRLYALSKVHLFSNVCYCSSQAIQVEATPSAPGGCTFFLFRGRISSSSDTFGAVRTGVRRFFSSQCGRYPAVAIFCESRLAFRLQFYILYCCLSCIDYFDVSFRSSHYHQVNPARSCDRVNP